MFWHCHCDDLGNKGKEIRGNPEGDGGLTFFMIGGGKPAMYENKEVETTPVKLSLLSLPQAEGNFIFV